MGGLGNDPPAAPSPPRRAHARDIAYCHMGVSENLGGALFWGPYNKDPTISGTVFGSPIFGNSHIISIVAVVVVVVVVDCWYKGQTRYQFGMICYLLV